MAIYVVYAGREPRGATASLIECEALCSTIRKEGLSPKVDIIRR